MYNICGILPIISKSKLELARIAKRLIIRENHLVFAECISIIGYYVNALVHFGHSDMLNFIVMQVIR